MPTRKAATLTLALLLTTATAYADHAQLLEDCGGHTNYGLQRNPSDTSTPFSDSTPTLTMHTVKKKSKAPMQKEHPDDKQNEQTFN